MLNTHQYAAIDPLALLLSGRAYLQTIEKNHPHVPLVSVIQEVVHAMTPEEKAFSLSKAKTFMGYSKAIEEAIRAEHAR